jgi:ABC-type cobalt transport system substrate-binding protein
MRLGIFGGGMYGRGAAQILILALIVAVMTAMSVAQGQEWCCSAREEPLYPDPELRPAYEPGPEYPPASGEVPDSRLTLVNALLVAMAPLAGFIGFALGRRSMPKPPSKAAVADAISGAANNRIGEAKRHGITAAEPLLEKLRDDATAAVQKLLPKK